MRSEGAPEANKNIEQPDASISLARTHLRIVEGEVVQLEGYMDNVADNLPSLSSSADAVKFVEEELGLAVSTARSLANNFKSLDGVTAKIPIDSEEKGAEVKELIDEALLLSTRMNDALTTYSKAIKALEEVTRGRLH